MIEHLVESKRVPADEPMKCHKNGFKTRKDQIQNLEEKQAIILQPLRTCTVQPIWYQDNKTKSSTTWPARR